MKTTKFAFFTYLAVLVCVTMVVALSGTANAQEAQAPWRYRASHGMTRCAFAAFGPGGAVVNTATTAVSTGVVTITGEQGSSVTLRLICERSQKLGERGELVAIGHEGNYSGPNGAGVPIGVDTAADRATGYSLPKGREWTVAVGASPATHQLSWSGELGTDRIAVTVQPVAPPPTLPVVQQLIEPVQQTADQANNRAEEAWDRASHSWEHRVFALTGSYVLDLDSLGQDTSARMGFGLDGDVLLGGDPNVKFLTGLTFDLKFRQKPVQNAPNMPVNGFNSYVDWKTVYIGPKFGLDWMPVGFFALRPFGSLGALISIDDTLPLTQLPDGTLYSQESQTRLAFGYKLGVDAMFCIADHFILGPGFALQGNFTPQQEVAGPQVVTDGSGRSYEQIEGHWLDVTLQFKAGAQF